MIQAVRPKAAYGKGRFVVRQRFGQVGPCRTFGFVYCTGDRRKLRQPYSGPTLMSKADRFFDLPCIRLGMTDDNVGSNKAGSGRTEMLNRRCKLPSINLSSRGLLPGRIGVLEAKEKCFESRPHHEVRQMLCHEARIQGIGSVKRKRMATTDCGFKKWNQNLFRPEKERIVIERDVTEPQIDQLLQLIQAVVRRARRESGP